MMASILFGAIISWCFYFGLSDLTSNQIGQGISWLIVLSYIVVREFKVLGGLWKKN